MVGAACHILCYGMAMDGVDRVFFELPRNFYLLLYTMIYNIGGLELERQLCGVLSIIVWVMNASVGGGWCWLWLLGSNGLHVSIALQMDSDK